MIYQGNATITKHSSPGAPKESEIRINEDKTNITYETTGAQRKTAKEKLPRNG